MAQTLSLDEFLVHYERKTKPKCQICSSSFKFANAEHICKRCFRSVCTDCSPFKVKCYMANFKNNLHRMCRKCHIESEVLQKYVKTHRLKWGEDSDLVKLWLRQLGIKAIPKKRNSQKRKMKFNLTFMDIWKSLNFSFRQFIGIVLDESKIPEVEVAEMVNLALSELSSNKLADLHHVVYLTLFFLAHSSIHNALYFTTLVIQLVYSQEPCLDNIHYFLEQMNCSQMQVYKMESILEETLEKMVKRCTVNFFTAEVSIQVMGMLMAKRDFEELEKGIAFVFNERKEFICQNSNKPEDVILDILRNISTANYRKRVKEIDRENSGSEQYSPETKSAHSSQKSQTESNISSSSKKVRDLKKQNELLVAKVKEQALELEALRKEVEIYRSPTRSPKDEKKSLQLNILSKNISEITMGKDKGKEKYDQSTSEENDEANFTNVIHKKNEEIIKLKKQLQAARDSLNIVLSDQKISTPGREIALATERKVLKQKQEQIQKLRLEAESLKNTNKRLFMKLNELTNLLMDKEEKNIKEANKFFEELPKDGDVAKDKQCKIY